VWRPPSGNNAFRKPPSRNAGRNLFNREYTAYLSEGRYLPGRNVKLSVTQRF